MTQSILGIDLGTTNTYAGIMDKALGQPVVIVHQSGTGYIPSVVTLLEKGEVVVGQPAKNRALVNPTRTVYGVKRLMGKSFAESQAMVEHVAFPIVSDNARNGAAAIGLNGKLVSPQEISAYILKAVKEAAEMSLGESVTKAVLTVPAYFNAAQRQATKDAGQLAGLEVLRIINNPYAVALAYGMGSMQNGTIAVYHLGGATFDISILAIQDGFFEVLATNYNSWLGGETIDDVLVEFLLKEIENAQDINLTALDERTRLQALQRIRYEAENAKKALSVSMEYEINLPYLAMNAGTPVHFEYNLERSQLEDLARGLIEKTIDPCQKALDDAGVTASDIHEVILDGGMTYMPLVVETVKRIFGGNPSISISVKPDEAAALGAVIQAEMLAS